FQNEVLISAVTLARHGFAVLAIDMVGYGERKNQGHKEGVWLPAAGLTLQGVLLWDNMCALDYLSSRDEVDPKRIGVTGSSGGGNQTMYLAAVDERVSVAVPVVSVEVFEDQVVSSRCYCEVIPGLAKFANVPDILSLIAPRPLLIINGVYDKGFTILRARKAFLKVKKIYEEMGASDKIAFYQAFTGHGYYGEMRKAMYKWFSKWLKGVEEEFEEDISRLPSEEDLLISSHFKTNTSGIAQIYYRKAIARKKKYSVEELDKLKEHIKQRLIEKVFGGFPNTQVSWRNLGLISYGNIVVRKVLIEPELDIFIPALMVKKERTEKACIILHPEGKNYGLRWGISLGLLEKGYTLVSIDYRGVGETYYNSELATKNSLLVGRHILGMRVFDVLKTLEYLENTTNVKNVEILGVGEGGLIGLFAVALNKKFNGLTSYYMPSTLLSSNGFKYPPTIFPPNILDYVDIPEVASLVAPRKLEILAPVDPHNNPLNGKDARKVFEFTVKYYNSLDASSKITIKGINELDYSS
ncbi:MAG TPA: hypothetical protein ENF87_01830, partial [Thermoproteales archaeon]|nr:hypothetical protein [Thermoproteales archaeon]